MIELWNKEAEKKFFTESVKFGTPEQLFYVTDYYQLRREDEIYC